jgi:hypothetical protein
MARHFSAAEISCRCGCGLNSPDPLLIEDLDDVRDELGMPIVLKSLCRCAAWNAHEGGAPNSAHLVGPDGYCHAVDVKAIDPGTKFLVFNAMWHRGYRRIGFGSTFIHFDNALHLPQRKIWTY